WRLGEWEDDTSDGTVAAAEKISTRYKVSTRFREVKIAVRGSEKGSTRFRKSVQGSEKKSILEGDVAQGDWWIKNISAAMKNDQNTLRSGLLIGWSIELTKMPPTPLGL
nr:hypothetical protein [Tanacetum cinerariifolium]